MKKIKIGILYCPNTYNYGSMMLGESTIYYLNKMLKKKGISPIFLVYTSRLENVDRLKRATNCSNIEMRRSVYYGETALERKIKKIIEVLKFVVIGKSEHSQVKLKNIIDLSSGSF